MLLFIIGALASQTRGKATSQSFEGNGFDSLSLIPHPCARRKNPSAWRKERAGDWTT